MNMLSNMLRRIRLLSSMVFLFVTTTVLHAQDSGWSVNEPDYQYDMTAYIELSLGGAVVDDYSNYEVGAFVGNECRGVAKVDSKNGYTWLYLRIWSNEASGETIELKTYDKTTGKTYRVLETIDFVSQSMVGQPSSPMTATVKTYTLGDVNDDGRINIADVASALSIMAGKSNDKFIREAADANEDGRVNIADIAKILAIIAGK